MHLAIVRLLSLLGVLVVRAEETEDDEPDVVEDHKNGPHLKDSNPNVSYLCRYPLCVLKVCNFEAEISQVNETTSETKRIHDGLLARVRMQLIEITLAKNDSLIL